MNNSNDNRDEAESNSSARQLALRDRLQQMFLTNPLPPEELMTNMALFARSSVLVKYLVINDLYERILNVPGAIMEFGVWWGQNLVLFENLRAIHEPFNKTRKIIGFDTFQGYTGHSQTDKDGSDIFSDGGYSTTDSYDIFLKELLAVHEGCSVLGHINGQHELVKGDVCNTVNEYFKDHPETIVALAYFDMGLYEPTKAALTAVLPHLVPGSVLLMDEFTWGESPGEAVAFKEVFAGQKYSITKCRFTPMRAIVTFGN